MKLSIYIPTTNFFMCFGIMQIKYDKNKFSFVYTFF